MAVGENVTLSIFVLVDCDDGDGFNCRFVEANVRCCIVDAPPSIARNINDPSNVYANNKLQIPKFVKIPAQNGAVFELPLPPLPPTHVQHRLVCLLLVALLFGAEPPDGGGTLIDVPTISVPPRFNELVPLFCGFVIVAGYGS